MEKAIIDFQLSLFDGPAQLPLTLPAEEAGVRSPLDDPRRDETIVLLKQGERSLAYTAGADLQPRPLSPGQLLRVMECAPGTPACDLPPDTNERVMAAYDAARRDAAARIGRARRQGTDTRLRRYLSRQLRLAREAAAHDTEELARIGTLQRIFLDYLPPHVIGELNEARRMELSGSVLVRRLEALRERHRLNPPEEAGTVQVSVEVMRIVCSDGLV